MPKLVKNPTYLTPGLALLCKLSSIVSHAKEAHGTDGHPFDVVALRQLLADAEVNEWLDEMLKHGFASVARHPASTVSSKRKP
jgi:hypothetical protein